MKTGTLLTPSHRFGGRAGMTLVETLVPISIAALLGGIVPSGGGYYSGGVENFPRFLENWSGRTLAYNGSMVVIYYSKIARAPLGRKRRL